MIEYPESLSARNPASLARIMRISRYLQTRVAEYLPTLDVSQDTWEPCSKYRIDSKEKLVSYCREVFSTYFGYNHLSPPQKNTIRYRSIVQKISDTTGWISLFSELKITDAYMRIGSQRKKRNVVIDTFFAGLHELLWEVFEPFQDDLILSAGHKYSTPERCIHVGRVVIRTHFRANIPDISLQSLRWMNWERVFADQNSQWLLLLIGRTEWCFFPSMVDFLARVFDTPEAKEFFLAWELKSRKRVDATTLVNKIAQSIERYFWFFYSNLPRRGTPEYLRVREQILSVDNVSVFCRLCAIPNRVCSHFSAKGLKDIILYCCYYFVRPDECALRTTGDLENRDFCIKKGKLLIAKVFAWKSRKEILVTLASITNWQKILTSWWFSSILLRCGQTATCLFCDLHEYLDCIFMWITPQNYFTDKRDLKWNSREICIENVRSRLKENYGIWFTPPDKNSADYLDIVHWLGNNSSLVDLLVSLGCAWFRRQSFFKDLAELFGEVFAPYGLNAFYFSYFGKFLMRTAESHFWEKEGLDADEELALSHFFEDGDHSKLFDTLGLFTYVDGGKLRDVSALAYERFCTNLDDLRKSRSYHSPRLIFRSALKYAIVMKTMMKKRKGPDNQEIWEVVDIDGREEPFSSHDMENILMKLDPELRLKVEQIMDAPDGQFSLELIQKIQAKIA